MNMICRRIVHFFVLKKSAKKNFISAAALKSKKLKKFSIKKIKCDDDEFETVGGLAMSVFKRVPEIDEEAKKYGLNFKIIDADNRVVKLVEISKISEE